MSARGLLRDLNQLADELGIAGQHHVVRLIDLRAPLLIEILEHLINFRLPSGPVHSGPSTSSYVSVTTLKAFVGVLANDLSEEQARHIHIGKLSLGERRELETAAQLLVKGARRFGFLSEPAQSDTHRSASASGSASTVPTTVTVASNYEGYSRSSTSVTSAHVDDDASTIIPETPTPRGSRSPLTVRNPARPDDAASPTLRWPPFGWGSGPLNCTMREGDISEDVSTLSLVSRPTSRTDMRSPRGDATEDLPRGNTRRPIPVEALPSRIETTGYMELVDDVPEFERVHCSTTSMLIVPQDGIPSPKAVRDALDERLMLLEEAAALREKIAYYNLARVGLADDVSLPVPT